MTSVALTSYDPSFATLLRRQSGVTRLVDASHYLGPGHIRTQMRRGAWQRPHPRVLVTHNGPLTRHQQMWVALLSSAPGAALCGTTAAELHGMTGFAEPEIHVVVGVGQRVPVLDGVVLHRSGRLDDRDVFPGREPPRTRPARSLVDAASWARTDRWARALVIAGVQQGLVTPAQLRDALARRGPCRRHALVVESIEDAEGGIHSVPEKDFDVIRHRFRLPLPARQALRRRPDGRYYLDADWPDYGLTAEIQGMPHMAVLQWDVDLDRISELAADGRRLVQFTSYAVRHRQKRVGELLVRGLRTGGWTG